MLHQTAIKKKKTGEQNDVRSHLHARETIYRQIKFIWKHFNSYAKWQRWSTGNRDRTKHMKAVAQTETKCWPPSETPHIINFHIIISNVIPSWAQAIHRHAPRLLQFCDSNLKYLSNIFVFSGHFTFILTLFLVSTTPWTSYLAFCMFFHMFHYVHQLVAIFVCWFIRAFVLLRTAAYCDWGGWWEQWT